MLPMIFEAVGAFGAEPPFLEGASYESGKQKSVWIDAQPGAEADAD